MEFVAALCALMIIALLVDRYSYPQEGRRSEMHTRTSVMVADYVVCSCGEIGLVIKKGWFVNRDRIEWTGVRLGPNIMEIMETVRRIHDGKAICKEAIQAIQAIDLQKGTPTPQEDFGSTQAVPQGEGSSEGRAGEEDQGETPSAPEGIREDRS